jgi:hypothetical protein
MAGVKRAPGGAKVLQSLNIGRIMDRGAGVQGGGRGLQLQELIQESRMLQGVPDGGQSPALLGMLPAGVVL